MSKYTIIANPTAGGGTGARQIPHIRQLLTDHKVDFELVTSDYPGHALELAKKAALAGIEVVVAAGGDGTVNEVLNGIMEAHQEGCKLPVMGVLCVGRGNDFAGSAGIPADLVQGCQVLIEGHRRLIDIGRVYGGKYPQGRYFANVLGVGFDAITTIEVRKLPRWGGFLSFLVAVIKTIFLYYKGPIVTVDYDGQTLTQPSLLVGVMNGRRLGGGFYLAPHAKLDDGLFDLCMAHEVGRLRIFSLLPHFMKGTQESQKEITTGRAARVSITAVKGVLPAETDGEIVCEDGKHLEVEMLPNLVEVICQPQADGA
jgi:diacylglycerol kinase (ATP)